MRRFLRTELGELLEVDGELLRKEVVVVGVFLADGLERRVLRGTQTESEAVKSAQQRKDQLQKKNVSSKTTIACA
jgi:hypothetical protein